MHLASGIAWISVIPWQRRSRVVNLRVRLACSKSIPFFTEEHRSLLPMIEESTWDRLEKSANTHFEWNAKINVISRKGFDQKTLVEKHYLPSLALLRMPGLIERWSDGVNVLDLGCGGGFPGLPLAIACPRASVILADGRNKKIMVVNECAKAAMCGNAQGIHARIPDDLINSEFDFILGRSVATLSTFFTDAKPVLALGKHRTPGLANGILYIKGGDLSDELSNLGCTPSLDLRISSDLLLSENGEKTTIGEDKRVLYFPTTLVLKQDTKVNAGRLQGRR